MASHITIMTGWCFRSLSRIKAIWRSKLLDVAKTLVCSLTVWSTRGLTTATASSLDYQHTSIARLQSALNAGAQVVHQHRKYDHISDVLKDKLHWLLTVQHIHFKLCITVYKVLHNLTPLYITYNCVTPTSVHSGHRLRSTEDSKPEVRRTRTEFGKTAFVVSVPSLWNTLPTSIEDSPI